MADAEQLKSGKMFKAGVAGSLTAAICCFTPLLVFAFAGAGLSAFVAGIDYVVFPVMFASLGVIALSMHIRAGRPKKSPKIIIGIMVTAFSALLIVLEFRYALRISLLAVILVVAYGAYLKSTKKNNTD